MWRNFPALAVVCLGLGLHPLAIGGEGGVEKSILVKFSPLHAWQLDSESPASIAITDEAPKPYREALCLKYRFKGVPGERVLLKGPKISIPETHLIMTLWVYGDRRMHTLVLFVVDKHGEHHSYEAININWRGWRRIRIHLLRNFRAHWGGDGNRQVDFPVRQVGIVLWWRSASPNLSGEIRFSGLTFITPKYEARRELARVEGLWRDLEHKFPRIPEKLRTTIRNCVNRNLAKLAQLRESLKEGAVSSDAALKHVEASYNRWHFLDTLAKMIEEGKAIFVAQEPAFLLTTASSLEKVGPRKLPKVARAGLSLKAARGEWECGQIVVVALERPLTKVSLQIEPLRHESGTILPDGAVNWNPVGCVELRHGEVSNYRSEFLPDVLMPPEPVTIPPLSCQSFWITVKVPRSAKAGRYRGRVYVLFNGKRRASINLLLQVFGFTLPERCHLKTAFGLNTQAIAQFYGEEDLSDEEYLHWAEFLIERRIHASRLVGSYHWHWPPEKCMKPDPPEVIRAQLRRFELLWCMRISNKLLGMKREERERYEQLALERLSQIVSQFRKQGLLQFAHLYTYDELWARHYEEVTDFFKKCREIAPSVRIMLTFFRDDPTEHFRKWVDIWCPHFHWVALHRDKIKQLQLSGAEVWWYFTQGDFPLPNINISAPAISHRIMFWQSFHFGFKGLLHWETCYWYPNIRRKPKFPDSSWLVNPVRRGRYLEYNGNGLLLYPGPNKTPLSSVRLEVLRDGAEDYEYLWLLRRSLEQGTVPHGLRKEAAELLDLSDLIQGVYLYTTDPEALQARRLKIAGILERIEAFQHRR